MQLDQVTLSLNWNYFLKKKYNSIVAHCDWVLLQYEYSPLYLFQQIIISFGFSLRLRLVSPLVNSVAICRYKKNAHKHTLWLLFVTWNLKKNYMEHAPVDATLSPIDLAEQLRPFQSHSQFIHLLFSDMWAMVRRCQTMRWLALVLCSSVRILLPILYFMFECFFLSNYFTEEISADPFVRRVNNKQIETKFNHLNEFCFFTGCSW